MPATIEKPNAQPTLQSRPSNLSNWQQSIGDAWPGSAAVTTAEAPPAPAPDLDPNPAPAPEVKTPETPAKPADTGQPDPGAKNEKSFEDYLKSDDYENAPFPRKSEQWKAWASNRKKKEDELGAKIQDLTRQLEAAAKKPAETSSAEIESIRKERDELSERLRLNEITNHPRFKAYFDNQISTQISLAKQIVGQDKADQIEQLLKAPDSQWRDSQIQEIIDELPTLQQTRIGSVLNNLSNIESTRQAEIERAKTDRAAMDEFNKKQLETQKADLKSKAESTFNQVLKSLQDPEKGLFLYQARNGDEEETKAVNRRIETARNLAFGQNNPETLAQAAFYASVLPDVLRSHLSLNEENTRLRKQVEELSKATPKIESTSESPTGTQPPSPRAKPGSNPMDAMSAWVRGTHQAMTG